MAKKAIVLLAEGFEEVEALTPVDYLRRAGIEVTIASVGIKDAGESPLVTGSHGIKAAADTALETLAAERKLESAAWDAVIVPGGLPGADNLAASAETQVFVKSMAGAGKPICSICASPARVLAPLGLLTGKKFTCYPGQEANIRAGDAAGAERLQDRVVIDGNLITSQGAGTAGEFSIAIIAKLAGEAEAEKLRERLLLCCC